MTKLTFAELTVFLERLGFTHRIISDSHHLFEHAGADTYIMLRPYEPRDLVEMAGLAYVRHTLDQWGIMERDQFDQHIRELSLAG